MPKKQKPGRNSSSAKTRANSPKQPSPQHIQFHTVRLVNLSGPLKRYMDLLLRERNLAKQISDQETLLRLLTSKEKRVRSEREVLWPLAYAAMYGGDFSSSGASRILNADSRRAESFDSSILARTDISTGRCDPELERV